MLRAKQPSRIPRFQSFHAGTNNGPRLQVPSTSVCISETRIRACLTLERKGSQIGSIQNPFNYKAVTSQSTAITTRSTDTQRGNTPISTRHFHTDISTGRKAACCDTEVQNHASGSGPLPSRIAHESNPHPVRPPPKVQGQKIQYHPSLKTKGGKVGETKLKRKASLFAASEARKLVEGQGKELKDESGLILNDGCPKEPRQTLTAKRKIILEPEAGTPVTAEGKQPQVKDLSTPFQPIYFHGSTLAWAALGTKENWNAASVALQPNNVSKKSKDENVKSVRKRTASTAGEII